MIIEAKRSVLTRLALLALPLMMSGLVAGCIAQPGEIGPDGEQNALHEERADDSDSGNDSGTADIPAEDEAVGYTATGTTGVTTGGSTASQTTTGIPATPGPNEPQPSHWKPNSTSFNSGAQANSPVLTPQPSPW
jgi:hypothetical protein